MLKDITLPPVWEESQAVICCGMYVSLLCIVLLGQTLHTLQPFHNVFPASSLDHSLTTLCDTVSLSIYLCRVPTVPFGNQMGGQNYIKFGRTGCLPSQGMIIPAWEDVLPYLAFDPLSLFHRTLNKISKWIKSPVIYLFELSKFSLDDICPSPPHHLLPVCGGGGGVEQSRDGGGGGDLHVLPACLWTICTGLVLLTAELGLSSSKFSAWSQWVMISVWMSELSFHFPFRSTFAPTLATHWTKE